MFVALPAFPNQSSVMSSRKTHF